MSSEFSIQSEPIPKAKDRAYQKRDRNCSTLEFFKQGAIYLPKSCEFEVSNSQKEKT